MKTKGRETHSVSTVTRCCCHQDGGLGGEVKGLGGNDGGGDPEDDLYFCRSRVYEKKYIYLYTIAHFLASH